MGNEESKPANTEGNNPEASTSDGPKVQMQDARDKVQNAMKRVLPPGKRSSSNNNEAAGRGDAGADDDDDPEADLDGVDIDGIELSDDGAWVGHPGERMPSLFADDGGNQTLRNEELEYTPDEIILVTAWESREGTSLDEEEKAEIRNARREIVIRLQRAGLRVKERLSIDKDEVFLYISAPIWLLYEEAQAMNIRVRLKDVDLGDVDPTIYHSLLYAPFRVAHRERYVLPFKSGVVQRIMWHIIDAPTEYGGADVNVDDKLGDGVLLQAFGMHDLETRDSLNKRWARKFLGRQPLDEVMEYLGPKSALYFGFAGYFQTALVLPGVLGLGIMAYGLAINQFDNATIPYFCIFLSLWSTFFLEFWKRRQATLAFTWNMSDFEETEHVRAGFKAQEDAEGKPVLKRGTYSGDGFVEVAPQDLVAFEETNKDSERVLRSHKYFPRLTGLLRMSTSYMIANLMIGVVIVTALAMLLVRVILTRDWDDTRRFGTDFKVGATVAALLNGVVISVLNLLYERLARAMNKWENHRTQTSYESHLSLKIFLFTFFNSYFSLFYLAYLKQNATLFGTSDTPCNPNCMTELTYQLGVTVISKVGSSAAIQVIMPYFTTAAKVKAEMASLPPDVQARITEAEKQAKLPRSAGVMSEYSHLVVQYGLVTMFAAAFPAGGFIVMLGTWLEIHIDANKMLNAWQRPKFEGAEDIGSFYDMLDAIGQIAVVTNLTMIAFVSDRLVDTFPESFIIADKSNPMYYKLAVVVLLEHFLFVFKFLVSMLIPDEPRKVTKAKVYQQWREEQLWLEAGTFKSWDVSPADVEGFEEAMNSDEEAQQLQTRQDAIQRHRSKVLRGKRKQRARRMLASGDLRTRRDLPELRVGMDSTNFDTPDASDWARYRSDQDAAGDPTTEYHDDGYHNHGNDGNEHKEQEKSWFDDFSGWFSQDEKENN